MRILVTGATANVGRMVVDELLASAPVGVHVRALTVDPARAALPPGVEVVRGSLRRFPDEALRDVDKVYLAPDPTTAPAISRQIAEAGVRHVVDMAGSTWQAVSRAVEAAGLPFTHLEPGEFMINSTLWAPQIQAGDVVRDAYPGAVNAPIAQEDIAAVAARVLLGDGHLGRTYELTGPEALSRPGKVAALAAGLGRDLTYVEVAGAEAVELFESLMGEYGQWYLDGLAQLVDHPQAADPTVAALLGRPAMSYSEWAHRHADLFG